LRRAGLAATGAVVALAAAAGLTGCGGPGTPEHAADTATATARPERRATPRPPSPAPGKHHAAGAVTDAAALRTLVTRATHARRYVTIEVTSGGSTATTQAEYGPSGTRTHTTSATRQVITIGSDVYVNTRGYWTRSFATPTDSAGFGAKLSGDLRDLGQQTVDGVRAHHYRTSAGIDSLIAAADSLPLGSDRADLLRQAKKLGVRAYVTDLWIDADHLPVKAVVSVQGGPAIPASTLRFRDWGKPVHITAPDLG
jgi:hypothetical protein